MPENAAQSEQVRAVAEQLFTVWKEQQKRESEETSRWYKSNVAGWVGAVIAIVIAIGAGFDIRNLATDANARSLRNEAAITTMRVDNSDRLARIETKEDQLVKDKAL